MRGGGVEDVPLVLSRINCLVCLTSEEKGGSKGGTELFQGESEGIFPEHLRTASIRRYFGATFWRRTILQAILAQLSGTTITEVTTTKWHFVNLIVNQSLVLLMIHPGYVPLKVFLAQRSLRNSFLWYRKYYGRKVVSAR